MSWNYNPSGTTARDRVRRRIGDINEKSPLMHDEEIADYLSEFSDDIQATAVACVEFILAKLARDIDRSNLGMNAQRSQQIQHYTDLLETLSKRSATAAHAYYGGGSYDDAESIESNDDFIRPAFTHGRDSNHG